MWTEWDTNPCSNLVVRIQDLCPPGKTLKVNGYMIQKNKGITEGNLQEITGPGQEIRLMDSGNRWS